MGGVGLVEEMTGLPIGHRAVRCPHADVPGMGAMNLEAAAIDFYEKNCIGCPYRQPVAMPNLATIATEKIAQRDRAREERAAQAHDAESQAEEARRMRRNRRAGAAATLPYGSARILDLLDRIDAGERDPAAERELVSTSRAAPELFTAQVAEALAEVVINAQNPGACESMRYVARHHGRHRELATSAAITVLKAGPHSEAAKILVEFGLAATAEDLRLTVQSLMFLAADRDFPSASAPESAPLMWMVNTDLTGVLEEIHRGLNSTSTWMRGVAADAAGRVAEVEPGTAMGLAIQLLAAIEQQDEDILAMPSESSNPRISGALSACIVADAVGVVGHLTECAREGDASTRRVIMRAFDRVIRNRMTAELPPEPGAAAIEFALHCLSDDWGSELVREAADLIDLASGYHPEAISPFVGDLFSWLIIGRK